MTSLNATLSAHDREHLEPFFDSTFYTTLHEKDTKQMQNRPMETTMPENSMATILTWTIR